MRSARAVQREAARSAVSCLRPGTASRGNCVAGATIAGYARMSAEMLALRLV